VLGIKCSTLHVDGKPTMVTMDYRMDVESLAQAYGRDLHMQERLVFTRYHTAGLGKRVHSTSL